MNEKTQTNITKGDLIVHPVTGTQGQVYAIDRKTRMIGVQWITGLRTAITFEVANRAVKQIEG